MNESASPLIVGGVMAKVFSPTIRSLRTDELVPPVVTDEKPDRYYFTLEHNLNQSIAFSAREWGKSPAFNYCYENQTWKLPPGFYAIGGKLRLETKTSEKSEPRMVEVDFPPIIVHNWGEISDDELKQHIAAIREKNAPEGKYALLSELVSLIKPGMRRRQVEMIFPGGWENFARFAGSKKHLFSTGMRTGSAQGVNYPIDENWSISLLYDYEGRPPGAKDYEYPENRLLAAPRLQRDP